MLRPSVTPLAAGRNAGSDAGPASRRKQRMVPLPSLSVIRYPASPFLHEERVFASLWPAWSSVPSETGRPGGRRPSPDRAKKQLEQWEAIPSASESMVLDGRGADSGQQAERLSDDESIAPEGQEHGCRRGNSHESRRVKIESFVALRHFFSMFFYIFASGEHSTVRSLRRV